MEWHGPVVPVMGRLTREDCLSSRVRGQPGQHRDTPNSRKKERKRKEGRRERKEEKGKYPPVYYGISSHNHYRFYAKFFFAKKWGVTHYVNF